MFGLRWLLKDLHGVSEVKPPSPNIPAYLRNAPEFRKTAKNVVPSIVEGPLLVKKNVGLERSNM